MSSFGFFGNYLGVQAKALHDGVVKTIVSFDPEGASQAQLDTYGATVHELEGIAAKAETQAQADERSVTALTVRAEQHVHAVELLEGQIASEGDEKVRSAKQKGLDKVGADAGRILGELEDAKKAAADSRGYADQMKAAHAQATEKWRTGKARLETAKREQERARQEASRATERRADAERANGLAGGLDTGDLAINAMAANTAALRQKAEGAKLTTAALTACSVGDDEAAKALAAVTSGAAPAGAPTSGSLRERLAAAKG